MKVNCPRCGNITEYTTENKFRPFCSERCQLIDLGEWASESYRVPVASMSPNEDLESLSEDELREIEASQALQKNSFKKSIDVDTNMNFH